MLPWRVVSFEGLFDTRLQAFDPNITETRKVFTCMVGLTMFACGIGFSVTSLHHLMCILISIFGV